MTATHFSGHVVMAECCSNTVITVSGDTHTNTGATDQDASLNFVTRDCFRNLGGIVGVIHSVSVRWAEVDRFDPHVSQLAENFLFHLDAAMVAGNGDFHDVHSGQCGVILGDVG